MSLSSISSHSLTCIFISLAHDPHVTFIKAKLPVASMNREMMSSNLSRDGDVKKSLAKSRSATSFPFKKDQNTRLVFNNILTVGFVIRTDVVLLIRLSYM